MGMRLQSIVPRAFERTSWGKNLGFGPRLEIQLAAWAKHVVRIFGGRQLAVRLENRISFLEQDVNALLKESAQLRTDLATYQEIIKLAPVGIYNLDGQARILNINEAVSKALEFTQDEMRGHEIFEYLIPEQRENARQRFFARILGGLIPEKQGDRIYISKSGKRVHAITFNTDLKNPDRVVTCFLDVSRLREVEEELKSTRQAMIQQERTAAIGEATATMSHALKNLLAGAGGNVLQLKQHLLQATATLIILSTLVSENALLNLEQVDILLYEIRKLLCLLEKSIDGMAETTISMLDFARHGNDNKELMPILGFMKESIDELRSFAATNKTELRLEIRDIDDTDALFISKAAFKNIVRNLAINAVQAYDDPKKQQRKVKVQLIKSTGNTLMIIVTDYGKGMSLERQKELLKPHPTMVVSSKQGGSGVGFLVVRDAVASVNGQIKIFSKEEKGTTICIQGLALEKIQAPGPVEPVTDAQEIKVHNVGLFIVDDQSDVCHFFQQLALSMGFSVTAFTNPQECLSAYRQTPIKPQIILTDFKMPQMTGLELLQKIRELMTKHMPQVIIVTGNELSANEIDQAKNITGQEVAIFEKGKKSALLRDLLVEAAKKAAGSSAVTITDRISNEASAITLCRQIAAKTIDDIDRILGWDELGGGDAFSDEIYEAVQAFLSSVNAMQQRAVADVDLTGPNLEQEKVINVICRIILRNGLLELKEWIETNKTNIDLKNLDRKANRIKKILRALNNLYNPKDLFSERWRAVFNRLIP